MMKSTEELLKGPGQNTWIWGIQDPSTPTRGEEAGQSAHNMPMDIIYN